MNVNSERTNICLITGISHQCLSCRLGGLVNFGQIFALFLDAFIVKFENFLFILYVIKSYPRNYLCGTTNRYYIYRVVAKH